MSCALEAVAGGPGLWALGWVGLRGRGLREARRERVKRVSGCM